MSVAAPVAAERAWTHPTRQRIIAALTAGDDGLVPSASPKELAAALDEPLGNVSYHVRYLVDCGLLTLVDTAPRRGAVEHWYRLTDGIERCPTCGRPA